jgi:hypothetical protein
MMGRARFSVSVSDTFELPFKETQLCGSSPLARLRGSCGSAVERGYDLQRQV